MAAASVNHVVTDVIQETDDVRSYRFSRGPSPLDFIPGQFVVVSHPTVPGLRAPLTLSSSPADGSRFELTVKRTGNFGAAFYDSVKAGDTVSIGDSQGNFVLDAVSETPVCFIGWDYTMPAARSFLRWVLEKQPKRTLVIFHALHAVSDQLYSMEFGAAHGRGCVHYFALLEQGSAPPDWVGYREPCTARAVLATLAEWPLYTFYLTGERPDVVRMKKDLLAAGLLNTQLLTEPWS